MSHDTANISDADLLRQLNGSVALMRKTVAHLQQEEPRPWRYEVWALGVMCGAVTDMAEVLRRQAPTNQPAESAAQAP